MSLNQYDQLVIGRGEKLIYIDLKCTEIEKRQSTLLELKEEEGKDKKEKNMIINNEMYIKWSNNGRLLAMITNSKLYIWKLIEPVINKVQLIYESFLSKDSYNYYSFIINGQWMDDDILLFLTEKMLHIYRDKLLISCEFGLFIDFICMKIESNNISIYALDHYNSLNRINLEKFQNNIKFNILETLDLGIKKVTRILGICLNHIILLHEGENETKEEQQGKDKEKIENEQDSLLFLVKIDNVTGHMEKVNFIKISKGNQYLIYNNDKIIVIRKEEILFYDLSGEINNRVELSCSNGTFFSCNNMLIQMYQILLCDEYFLFKTIKNDRDHRGDNDNSFDSKLSRLKILQDKIINELIGDGVTRSHLAFLYHELAELNKDKRYENVDIMGNGNDLANLKELERNVLTGLPLIARASLLECNKCNGKRYSEESKKLQDPSLWWVNKWYYNCPCGGLWRQVH